MSRIIHGFDFHCPSCGKVQRGRGDYDKDKQYTCSECKWAGKVPKTNKMYNTKEHPLVFICPYCNKVQRTYDDEFKGEIDGYYTTECDCPECRKHIILKTESPTHYFINQLKLENGGNYYE